LTGIIAQLAPNATSGGELSAGSVGHRRPATMGDAWDPRQQTGVVASCPGGIQAPVEDGGWIRGGTEFGAGRGGGEFGDRVVAVGGDQE
jgi:hypothetical protein